MFGQGLATRDGSHAYAGCTLRLRGLPYTADETDVKEFFEGFHLVSVNVVRKNGKTKGEAYALFGSEEEAAAALRAKNKQSMGNRYIELFADAKVALRAQGTNTTAAVGQPTVIQQAARIPIPYSNSQYLHTANNSLHTGMTYAQASKEGHRGQHGLSPNGVRHDSSTTVSESNSASSTPGTSSSLRSVYSVPRPVTIRLRGLPFSAQESDVHAFFEGLQIREIIFTMASSGRPTGEAFVEFMDHVSWQSVLNYDKRTLGKRYIEIFRAGQNEMFEAQKYSSRHMNGSMSQMSFSPSRQHQLPLAPGKNGVYQPNTNAGKGQMLSSAPEGTVLKLRGLPYTTAERDIVQFFDAFKILNVILMRRPEKEGRVGTCNGVAYVQFVSAHEAENARLTKHKKMMGSRYIECMTHKSKSTPLPVNLPGISVIPQMPLQTSSAENMVQNQYVQNEKAALTSYGNSQIWSTNPVPSTGLSSLQQQLQKMGFSEKGESLFSDASLLTQIPNGSPSDESGTFSAPLGFGATNPWSVQSENRANDSLSNGQDPWDKAYVENEGFKGFTFDSNSLNPLKPLW